MVSTGIQRRKQWSRLGRISVALLLACATLALTIGLVRAVSLLPHWGSGGVAVSQAQNDQGRPTIASDGDEGAIVAWADERGTDTDIYVQRVLSNGALAWSSDGVPVITSTGNQTRTYLAPDGDQGAIVVWQDDRAGNWDIYAQRVLSDGTKAWPISGTAVCTATSDQHNPQVVPDDNGGVIVAWLSDPENLVLQRLTGDGTLLWPGGGISVSVPAAQGASLAPPFALIADGFGGAILAWETPNGAIRAQRILSDGTRAWSPPPVIYDWGNNAVPRLVPDANGGAIVAWLCEDENTDIYARRVLSDGTLLPVAYLVEERSTQEFHDIASDGEGGAIVAWTDRRGETVTVFAQRMLSNGATAWVTDGVTVCATAGQVPYLVPDGLNGAIVTWWSWNEGGYDIRVRRLLSNGVATGDTNGILVGRMSGLPRYNFWQLWTRSHSTPDEAGGMLIAWESKGAGDWDIWAQHVGLLDLNRRVFLPLVLRNS